MDAVLDDWRAAPIDARLRAACGLIEKLTLEPLAMSAADVEPLVAAGVSDEGVEDVVHVCAMFNMYDRIADALGFEVPGPEVFDRIAPVLLKRGYR